MMINLSCSAYCTSVTSSLSTNAENISISISVTDKRDSGQNSDMSVKLGLQLLSTLHVMVQVHFPMT